MRVFFIFLSLVELNCKKAVSAKEKRKKRSFLREAPKRAREARKEYQMRMMSSLLLHKTNARENTRAQAKSREGVFLLSNVSFRFVPFCPRGGRKKKARKNNREREEIWIVAVTLIFEEEKYAAETPFLEEEERKQEFVVVVV